MYVNLNTILIFTTIVTALSCTTGNEYASEYREINLITAQTAMCVAGEEGVQYNGGENSCQMFLCCNEDEMDFWSQGMLISFESTSGELIEFVFVDQRVSVISNVDGRDDYWVNMRIPPATIITTDWDYMALLFPEFKQEGTYRFRVRMRIIDSGRNYHSQLFQLDLFEKDYVDQYGASITGYWARLNVVPE